MGAGDSIWEAKLPAQKKVKRVKGSQIENSETGNRTGHHVIIVVIFSASSKFEVSASKVPCEFRLTHTCSGAFTVNEWVR